MRRKTVSGFALTGLLLLGATVVSLLPQAEAQHPDGTELAASIARGELIALSAILEDGRQQVTVVDPGTRAMSVYHVDPTTGAISLKSVRNIAADLEMDDFNGGSPSPGEIRALLHRN